MAETNQTNVLAAFEMLLEEIENEVELVNRVGARAINESNYERAEAAVNHGKQLKSYRQQLAGMRRQWRDLMADFDVEADEDEETKAQRRDLGRLGHGVRTPEEAYRLPTLRALQEMGGSGKTAKVVDRVGEMMKDELKEVDHQALPSSGQLRWRNAAQWARNAMVNEGLMKDDSPRGVWEISEEGREYLKAHADKT